MKRKANRVLPEGQHLEYYSISIFKLNGEYIAALIHLDKGIVDHFSHYDFNAVLTIMMNKARKLFIKETVLFNGSQRLAYYGWPPALSLEFIENFYTKKNDLNRSFSLPNIC
jgi:hypothetical protein